MDDLADRVRTILHYDPDTGIFTWLVTKGRSVAGKRAGTLGSDGYTIISIKRRLYRAHRLAWLYSYGTWPTSDIDHIDLNRTNNRLVNLREATPSQNHANRRAQSNNSSGLKGAHTTSDGKWRSSIQMEGRNLNLGRFKTAEEAHAAYCKASEEMHGEFANTSEAQY